MLDFIKNWTVDIVILALFIVVTEMLLPKGRMKKYANLLTGAVLVIAIIEPVTGLFGKTFDFSYSHVAAAGSIDKKEIEKASLLFEEEQVKQTIRLYRKRVIEQIEHQAREVEGVKNARADVIINEDPGSPSFGEIKRIYIEAEISSDTGGDSSAYGRNGSGMPDGSGPSYDANPDLIRTPGIRDVEKIKIGSQDSRSAGTAIDRRLEERLSGHIADVFGINCENIIITQVVR